MIRRFIFAISFISSLVAYAAKSPKIIPGPRDLPTAEALMKLHKLNASVEREALQKLNLSLAMTNQSKNKAIDFHEVRTTLNTRTANALSYIVLASHLAYVTKDLYDFSREFANFTLASTSTLFKKPMCTWYYIEAVNTCTKEIKNMNAMIVRLGANNLNILQATMEEKLQLINTIKSTVDKCRSIINDAYLWCSFMVQNGFYRLFIEDILNSKVTDQIAQKVISQYEKL